MKSALLATVRGNAAELSFFGLCSLLLPKCRDSHNCDVWTDRSERRSPTTSELDNVEEKGKCLSGAQRENRSNEAADRKISRLRMRGRIPIKRLS